MRKTLTILAVVVIVAALFAMPGLAAARGGNGGGNGGGRSGGNGGTWFNVYGTIIALDDGEKTIDVDVEYPLKLAKYESLEVETTVDTRFRQCEGDTCSRIYFKDLEEGLNVRIKGIVKDGVFIATTVIQYVVP